MIKILIAAVAKNGVIGRSSGEMPWYSKEEFAHFKKTTRGFPVIMGRKTFESLGKPLEDRLNIVLSKKNLLKQKFEGLVVHKNLIDAFKYCADERFKKIFVIGGRKIFEEAMKQCDEMILSHMSFKAEGDIFFPKINFEEWNISNTEKHGGFEIITYKRKN